MIQDIDLPEVQAIQQNARFFRDKDRDYVEISFVGERDTLIKRVTPELMAKFRPQWDAYCDGVPPTKREGTPLTDIANLNEQLAGKYIAQNVHTAEELAVLSDMQCQALGHGTLTFRKAAQDMLALKKLRASEEAIKKISKAAESAVPMPAEADPRYASKEDVDEIKNQMNALAGMMAQLLEKKKPGRPKKEAQD